jgi:hypothetical protein
MEATYVCNFVYQKITIVHVSNYDHFYGCSLKLWALINDPYFPSLRHDVIE